MSVSGLNCVESCLNCHLRSRSFFCDLSQDSIEAFNRIKHAAVFPEHAVVLAEGDDRRFARRLPYHFGSETHCLPH